MPTSTEIGRISVGPRPSTRSPVLEDGGANLFLQQALEGLVDRLAARAQLVLGGSSAVKWLSTSAFSASVAPRARLVGIVERLVQPIAHVGGDRSFERCIGLTGGMNSRFGLPASSRSSSCRSQSCLQTAWPGDHASSISSSVSSCAPASTISTASRVPATTRSSAALVHLRHRRVDHELAVDIADQHGADRPRERDVGDTPAPPRRR